MILEGWLCGQYKETQDFLMSMLSDLEVSTLEIFRNIFSFPAWMSKTLICFLPAATIRDSLESNVIEKKKFL